MWRCPRRLTLTTHCDSARTQITLEVEDNGPGMLPQVQARIFEPFFTTKPPGVGTGLGLPLCLGIIEGHGGTIQVRGSRAGCYFPGRVARGGSAGDSAHHTRPAHELSPVQGQTILLVDDEPAIATALTRVLPRDGYTVDTAANGRQALARLQGRVYDLILSDLRMPELDGPGLYRALEQQYPALCRRFVFLTGDTLSPETLAFFAQTEVPRLIKPFDAAAVRRAIRQLLRARVTALLGSLRHRTGQPQRHKIYGGVNSGIDHSGIHRTIDKIEGSDHEENGPASTTKKPRPTSATAHANGVAVGTSDLRVLLAGPQAMRDGNFSIRLPGDWTGLEGKIADTFNEIVAANQTMAQELQRVGQVVGKEGKTRERTRFHQSQGAWGEVEVSVNTLIDDLLRPTTEVTRAIAAVAQGNLTQTVRLDVDGRPLEGEFLRSATIVNTMIQQLGVFTAEVTRVAREVGSDGKLGGQAQVGGVSGVWKDLTESVNSMASNLTAQVRNIAEVTIAVANGDLSRKITVDVRGEILQLKEAINTMVDQLRSFASEVTRVAREVGTEGKLGGQAVVPGVAGTWKDLTDNVNLLAGNLTAQVRNIAEVTTAVARGDLSRKIAVDVKGEILELKNTINTMVDQLNAFASEVTRVAREVGTEGKLGGQAQVPGVGARGKTSPTTSTPWPAT